VKTKIRGRGTAGARRGLVSVSSFCSSCFDHLRRKIGWVGGSDGMPSSSHFRALLLVFFFFSHHWALGSILNRGQFKRRYHRWDKAFTSELLWRGRKGEQMEFATWPPEAPFSFLAPR
jgi:hypothetical protein